MFRSTPELRRALTAVAFLLVVVPGLSGQTNRRNRRSANRQARRERNIQDAYSHRWEVAGGGGYLRFRSGEHLQKNNEVNFFATGGYALNPKLSVIADSRGYFGNAKINNTASNNTGIFRPSIAMYTFMGGVQYRFKSEEKYSVSGVVTAGTALSDFAGNIKPRLSTDIGLWPDSNARAVFSAGVNLDYNLYNNFAVRVEPNYLGTTFGGTVQNNIGVNVGVVYRFGRQ